MFIYPPTALSVPEALFKTTTGSCSLLCQFRSIFLPRLFKRTVNTRWKHKYFKVKGLSGTNIVINWRQLVKVTTVMSIVGYYFCVEGECFYKGGCNVF
jgi:hypothetical protein